MPLRPMVAVEVSVSDRVQVLMEPDHGVVWIRATLPERRWQKHAEEEHAILQAVYDARWAVAEWARDAGLIPLKQSLGYRGGFPYFFDGTLAAVGFESSRERCGERCEILHRET